MMRDDELKYKDEYIYFGVEDGGGGHGGEGDNELIFVLQ